MPRPLARHPAAAVLLVLLTLAAAAAAAAPFENLAGAETPRRISNHASTTCIDYGLWTVTTRPLEKEAGSAIYRERSARSRCGAQPRATNLVVNRGASHFLGRIGRYLLVDQGTGPSLRHLLLFDVTTRRQAYQVGYSRPLAVDGPTLSFWSPTPILATAANCAALAQIKSNGLHATIERRVSLALQTATPTLIESTALRCEAVQ